jgi:hypothetical protein
MRELYRPSDSCLSAKLVSTFADRGCHVVSVTNPYSRNLGFYMPGFRIRTNVLTLKARWLLYTIPYNIIKLCILPRVCICVSYDL